MRVTIILCTYNRCTLLEKALNSVIALDLSPSIELETLVVDNNSTDKTSEVVDAFCRAYPDRFRYLFEPRQGKSHALNTGIREATGEILAFMDDDVVVESGWLRQLTANMSDQRWAGVGGRILPIWSCPPPGWLSLEGRYAMAPFAAFDVGSEPGPLIEPPFGTNMAFRKEMFDVYGGFRTDLGPCTGSLIRNEDTEFGKRLLDAGETLRYEPSAIVYHPVSPERVRKDYLLSWWFDKGRADIRETRANTNLRCITGVPVYLLRRLISWSLRWWFTIDARRRFQSKINVWLILGNISESFRLWLKDRRLDPHLSPQ